MSDQGDESESRTPASKKHNSGAGDLERVTDYAEEKELNTALQSNVADLVVPQSKAKAEKIVIRKEDVEIMMRELEVSKQTAERRLREHRGNIKDAIRAVLAI